MNSPSLSMRAAWQQVATEAEAILDLHSPHPTWHVKCSDQPLCEWCDNAWPCSEAESATSIRVTALAQINALNEAPRVSGLEAAHGVRTSENRIIHDPETT